MMGLNSQFYLFGGLGINSLHRINRGPSRTTFPLLTPS